MQTAELYQIYLQHPSVQTDTRKLKPGDLFFALRGENFNGNQFAKQALDAGAAFAVVDEGVDPEDERIIRVDNTLDALQMLAKHHRMQFKIPLLAITGSNGKTTTKELIHAVLSAHFKTYTTEGNLNNHIGIPLTLLKIKPDAEIAVVEMGANHQQEIAGYCSYTLPTHGLITNVGKAHLEGFGGIEGVKKGKGELFDYIRAHDGAIFMNTDYDYLMEMSSGIKNKISYGTGNAAATQGTLIASEPFLSLQLNKDAEIGTIHTQLVGAYNLPNVLAAVAVGKYFGVPAQKIKGAIEAYAPSNSRSQLLEKNGNTIILDAYNANPSSMKEAIENFARLATENKILMLGAMAELGTDTEKEHQQLVQLLQAHTWKQVLLAGEAFEKINHDYLYFKDVHAAASWFKTHPVSGCHILIKGSRSMQMEKMLAD